MTEECEEQIMVVENIEDDSSEDEEETEEVDRNVDILEFSLDDDERDELIEK